MISSEKTEMLLQAIGNNDSVGVTIIDKDGIVIFRNNANEQISGRKNSDILGKHASAIPGEELLKVLKTGIRQLGVPYTTPTGTKAIVHRFPLHDKTLKTIGAMSITIFRDVKDMEKILNKYKLMKSKLNYYEEEIQRLRSAKYSFSNIVGNSDKIKSVIQLANKYAASNYPILITGETGSGKELFAHAIHIASPRKSEPFIIINCPSIPEELLESELFGYEPGAFSGAKKDGKIGKFEMANNGTIFLDEISSLGLQIQPKLLRVLQDHKIERLGGNKYFEVNFRVISATNKDLKNLVNQDLFREDLYYRLSVLNINLPPLREIREDIPFLVEHFIKSFGEEDGLIVKGISENVLNVFWDWSWPGNIRELKNVLKKAAISSDTKRIELKGLPDYLPQMSFMAQYETISPDTNLLKQSKQNVERNLLEKTLKKNNWNKSRTARQLRVSRPQLYTLIKKYGLVPRQ